MLALEAVEPAPLVGPCQLLRGFLREVEVCAAAPLLDVIAFAADRSISAAYSRIASNIT